MQDFPANSQKAKARFDEPTADDRPEKIERITSAEVNRRPKGLGRKFKETFIGGNSRMAIEYIVTDVFIPAVQDTMIEAFQGGIERLIKGEGRSRRGPTMSSYSNVGHVDYRGLSNSNPTRMVKPPTSRPISRQSRARQTFDEIVIPSRAEAETVLETMFEILSRHGMTTVSELYEMTGIQGSHTDHKWGWTQLRGARVTRLPRGGGYLLDLPEPEPLT